MFNPFEESDTDLWDRTNDEDPAVKLEALETLAERYFQHDKYAEAISAANGGIVVAQQTGNKVVEAEMYHTLGLSYGATNRYDEALEAFDQAINIHSLYSGERFVAQSLYFKGIALRDLERFDAAEDAWLSSIALYENSGMTYQAADVCCVLGDLLRNVNRHETAVNNFKRALAFAEEISNFRMAVRANDRLALTLLEMGRPQEALEHANKALILVKFLEDDFHEPNAKLQVAQCLYELERYEDALVAADFSVAKFKTESQRFEHAARAQALKCQILVKLNRVDEALELHSQLQVVFETVKDKNEALYLDIDFGLALGHVKGKLNDAVALLTQARDKAGTMGDSEIYAFASLNLAEIHLAKEQSETRKRALEFLEDANEDFWGEAHSEVLRLMALEAETLHIHGLNLEAFLRAGQLVAYAKACNVSLDPAKKIIGGWARPHFEELQTCELLCTPCPPIESE